MTRNIKIFLLTEAVLAGFGGFILPIYVLYFRYYQVTLLQVALLAAIFEASVLVFEVPTGLFADRFGRKLSVCIGFGLFAGSGLVFILWRQFTGFAVAEVLFGLAEAFISGAGEALAVDSIPGDDSEPILKRLFTRRSRIRIAVTSAMMIAAGYLFVADVAITFYPVLAGGAAGGLLALFYTSDRKTRRAEDQIDFTAPIKTMLASIKRLPVLKMVFVLALVSNFAFEAADQYWQVLSTELFDLDIKFFGFITAAGSVVAFILVGPAVKHCSGNFSLSVLILLVAGIAICSMPNIPAAGLPLLLVLYFISREMIRPVFSVILNRNIESTGRATFISGYNLTCSIGEVISGVMIGLIASRLGLPIVFVIGGGVLVVIVLGVLFRLSAGGGRRPG